MRSIFYIDWAMCGGESLPADFDLEEFCEVLQGKVPDLEVVPITDSEEIALNRAPNLISETALREALGEYCHQ